MFGRIFSSTQVKFVLIMLPFVVMASTAATMVNGINETGRKTSDLRDHLEAHAMAHTGLLAMHMEVGNVEMLQLTIADILTDTLVEDAVLFDETGSIVSTTQLGNEVPGDFLTFEAPIIAFHDNESREIGRLRLIASRPGYLAVLKSAILQDAALMFSITLSIVVGAMLANRYLVGRPLSRLLDAIHMAGSLEDQGPIDWHSKDELGEVIAAYSSMMIQQQANERALKESELRLQSILESSPLGASIVTSDGALSYANTRMLEILGISMQEFLDSNASEFYADPTDRDKIVEWLKKGYRLRDNEVRLKKKDGHPIWALVTFEPVEAGSANRFFCWVQDVSDRKAVEDELQVSRELLEDQAHTLRDLAETTALEKMRAEEATAAKTEFLANMSHEIRTPMNAIIGFSDLILETELTPIQSNYLVKLQTASRSLLGIINEILDLSKIEAGKLELHAEPFDLNYTVENLLSVVSNEIGKKNLELFFMVAPTVPRHIIGDSLRLGQVLLNLVNNAVKFTDKGGIVVRTWVDDRSDDRVRIGFSVQDEGIGISEEAQSTLFQPFSQADGSTTRKYGGTGLGLAISRNLVELMGGTIAVDSIPGKGSTFTFTADFQLSPEEMVEVEPSEPEHLLRNLVIAQATVTGREVLAACLASLANNTMAVGSGREALLAIKDLVSTQEQGQDAIILDYAVPGEDCVETLRDIRSTTRLSKVPVLITTTLRNLEEATCRTEEFQPCACVAKPISTAVIRDTLRRMLAGDYESARQISRQPEARLSDHLRGACALLVEDNEINQEVAQIVLEKAGLIVDIAGNGRQAVDMVAAQPSRYSVVLMDLQMPVMDGLEATRTIREDLKITDLPIIAMTAHAFEEEKQKCLDAGMNDHLAKPIAANCLVNMLSKWIRPGDVSPAVQPELSTPAGGNGAETGYDAISGIDVQEALQRLDIDMDFFAKLLEKFYSQHHGVEGELQDALAEADNERLERLAHLLKGMAGNISANGLSSSAEALETAIRSGEAERIPELTSRLMDALYPVLQSTSRFADDP